tara:strand:- start:72 stop:584 length:513 start_codon:yes stop_codon:yes gene_type:complete
MKISPHITLALISLSISLLFGCASFERGVPQKVTILSFPTEASVYVNGDAVGITPMQMSLPRKVVHEIRLEKHGFNAAVKYFAPVPNDDAHNFIRFGLKEDFGYYVDLEPSTMKTELKSELVPTSTGADPFERMAQQALEADRRLEAGEITPLEHKYIIEQIIEFFESKS